MNFETIKKRNAFKLVCKEGCSIYQPNFILKFLAPYEQNTLEIGFIVSKKCGNAVKRNKIKRRLKAAINYKFGFFTSIGLYVFIAKRELYYANYKELEDSIVNALALLTKTLNNKIQ